MLTLLQYDISESSPWVGRTCVEKMFSDWSKKSVGVINAESGDSEDDVTSSITHSKTAHLSWNAREH